MSKATELIEKYKVDELLKNSREVMAAINQLLEYMEINDEKLLELMGQNEFKDLRDSLVVLRRKSSKV